MKMRFLVSCALHENKPKCSTQPRTRDDEPHVSPGNNALHKAQFEKKNMTEFQLIFCIVINCKDFPLFFFSHVGSVSFIYTTLNGHCESSAPPARRRSDKRNHRAQARQKAKPPKAIAGVGWKAHISSFRQNHHHHHHHHTRDFSFLRVAYTHHTRHNQTLPSMTSTIGIPIKLLNEAQVRCLSPTLSIVRCVSPVAAWSSTRARRRARLCKRHMVK